MMNLAPFLLAVAAWALVALALWPFVLLWLLVFERVQLGLVRLTLQGTGARPRGPLPLLLDLYTHPRLGHKLGLLNLLPLPMVGLWGLAQWAPLTALLPFQGGPLAAYLLFDQPYLIGGHWGVLAALWSTLAGLTLLGAGRRAGHTPLFHYRARRKIARWAFCYMPYDPNPAETQLIRRAVFSHEPLLQALALRRLQQLAPPWRAGALVFVLRRGRRSLAETALRQLRNSIPAEAPDWAWLLWSAPEPWRQALALSLLPALTTAQARQLLRRALAHLNTLVRNTALQHPALARTLTATDWQALRHAPAAAVRIRAARGLGIEGGATAWPALCNMLQDPHPAVARAAAAALLEQDREAAAVLLRARLQNPSASPRRRAIFAELLGIHRCTEAVAVLRPLMLAHPSEFLGAAAAQALARLGPAGLAALLEALQEPQARVVRRSLGALRSVAPELIPPQTLERLLAHPDAELRLQAASLLYGYPPVAAAATPAPEDRQLATADASPGWR